VHVPIILPPISRRRFLAGAVAGGAGLLLRPPAFAAPAPALETDANRVALLSDPHVAADRALVARGANMFDNLTRVCAEVLEPVPTSRPSAAQNKLPAAVIINGDLAYLKGFPADYATAVEAVKPLRKAGLPVHLTLGNHDDRANMLAGIKAVEKQGVKEPVEGRHVQVRETPLANWFLLDSLDAVNATPGVLGEKQLAWLSSGLDERAKKPAIVMVHHNPDEKEKPSGLRDTKALLGVILPRKQVKALFYGHTHVWELKSQEGVHFINLPPVGYVFKAGLPSGWVDARVTDSGMTLHLRCVDPKHPKHGEMRDLEWRA
jgi:3',5'-cyclic AMP phosphodiesterase CpdA